MGFNDYGKTAQIATSVLGLRWETGCYTQATDATALIPTTLKYVVFGIAYAEGTYSGHAALGNTDGITVDISSTGCSFNGKVLHYIFAGW
jgi:hypothetical protein